MMGFFREGLGVDFGDNRSGLLERWSSCVVDGGQTFQKLGPGSHGDKSVPESHAAPKVNTYLSRLFPDFRMRLALTLPLRNGPAFFGLTEQEEGLPQAVDRAHQRRRPPARHAVLGIHQSGQEGRRRAEPQGGRAFFKCFVSLHFDHHRFLASKSWPRPSKLECGCNVLGPAVQRARRVALG